MDFGSIIIFDGMIWCRLYVHTSFKICNSFHIFHASVFFSRTYIRAYKSNLGKCAWEKERSHHGICFQLCLHSEGHIISINYKSLLSLHTKIGRINADVFEQDFNPSSDAWLGTVKWKWSRTLSISWNVLNSLQEKKILFSRI